MQPTSPNGLRIAWSKRDPGYAQPAQADALPETAAGTSASIAGVHGVGNRLMPPGARVARAATSHDSD